MTALHGEATTTDSTRQLPFRAFALIGLGGCWLAVAAAETLLGGLDALPSAAELDAGRGRVAAAGLLHVLGGMLLALGLAGVAAGAWTTVLGRIGLFSSFLLTAGLGAFGMFHLVALELPDEQLRAFDGFGPWGYPILTVLLGMTLSLPLLVAGLARSRDVPWWTFGVVAARLAVALPAGRRHRAERVAVARHRRAGPAVRGVPLPAEMTGKLHARAP